MNFNTQISTSVEQSRRLLAFGIKKETADMSLLVIAGEEISRFEGDINIGGKVCLNGLGVNADMIEYIPAWSLHRLIAMCPFAVEKEYYLVMRRNYVSYEYYDDVLFAFEEFNVYESMVKCIEYLIDCGHINKEYLEE